MFDLYPFGPWRPDVSDINGQHVSSEAMSNVLPQADGWGPIKGLLELSDALPAACRGLFVARRSTQQLAIFAATEDRLFLLDLTTYEWGDVSQGGSAYIPVGIKANWWFTQFNDVVLCGHGAEDVQAFTLASSSAFVDCPGSPPRAAGAFLVGRVVVLHGLDGDPRTIQWCDINDHTTWDGTGSSGDQTFPDGGAVMGGAGGEFGLVIQETRVRRMVFAPGTNAIFQFERLPEEIGAVNRESIVDVGGAAYFLSPKGFVQVAAGGGITPIGTEQVDRYLFRNWDDGAPQLLQGAVDPAAHAVIWIYRSTAQANAYADRAVLYNYALQRWAPISANIQTIVSLAQPGATLEGLDDIGAVAISGAADNGSGLIRLTVATTAAMATGHYRTISGVLGTTEANGSWYLTVIDGTHVDLDGSTFSNAYVSGGQVGGSLDALTESLDAVDDASLPLVAAVTSDSKLAFFSGDNLEATLDMAEQTNAPRRILVRGFYVESDAATVYGRVAHRKAPSAAASLTTEVAMDGDAFVPQRIDTRFARGRIRIPAATAWTYARGLRPDIVPTGMR